MRWGSPFELPAVYEADDKGSPAFSGHFDLFAAETQVPKAPSVRRMPCQVWIRDTCRLARADETLQAAFQSFLKASCRGQGGAQLLDRRFRGVRE